MSTSPASWTVPFVTSSTNLGPLITPLALPSDCLSKLWDFSTPGLQPSAQQSLYTYLTQGCAVSSCCPSSAPYSEAYQWLTTYYSPAVCPVSYKACAGPSNLTPGPSETAAFCCPAAYNCPSSPSPWWACQSDLSTTTTVYEIDTFPTQQTIATETVTWDNHWVVAYPIQIRWQQKDLASFSSATMQITTQLSSSSTEAQPSSSTNTQQAVSTSSAAVKQNTSGLSTGAKAGIGIGAAAIFIVFLIVAVFWIRRKRRAKDSPTMVEQEQWRRQELDGNLTEVVRKPEMRAGASPIKMASNDFVGGEHPGPNEIEGLERAELAGG